MSEITVPHVEPPYPFEAFAHVVEPLTQEDGGGAQESGRRVGRAGLC
ncbi:MAG: hypothetical protein HY778_17035 [Betaproteobacteria bacterium]|nr:hypothetical protein [Betaproteobacteria bacterium]